MATHYPALHVFSYKGAYMVGYILWLVEHN